MRRRVTAYGPSSRHDIAWFSGLGLRVIDAALARAAGELAPHDGPDWRTYWDLREPPEPVALPGARLLPEFDALLCGFDPPARERFVDAANYRTLWHRDNGLLLAPLLLDGRLSGYWRLIGTGPRRTLDIAYFARTRRPRKAELTEPVAALSAALGVTVADVSVHKHDH